MSETKFSPRVKICTAFFDKACGAMAYRIDHIINEEDLTTKEIYLSEREHAAIVREERSMVWEEAANRFELAFERHDVVQDVLDFCADRAKEEREK